MNKLPILLLAFAAASCSSFKLASPDGGIQVAAVENRLDIISSEGGAQTIVLGVDKVKKASSATTVTESYTMITGKRRECSNSARVKTFSYDGFSIEVRAYNDGVAYRFIGPEPESSYIIPDGKKRWMFKQKIDYEGVYQAYTAAETGEWSYPALVEYADGAFGLITEAGNDYGQCGSHFTAETGSDVYKVTLADAEPSSDKSAWRLIIMGGLADIVESTLVTDIAEPCALDDISWIKPGLSAWIYWSSNRGSRDFQKVIPFIDLAAEMKWPYNLLDGGWPGMQNGGTAEEAIAYATAKGVKTNVWYNSATTRFRPETPGTGNEMLTAESREAEMSRIQALGVTGIKVDFFGGDDSEMMDFYLNILKDAARHHLLVDFHGCTLPRGWQRTYPHLMTMEAVYGAEQYNNGPFMTNAAASHNVMMTFTRNVIGPMDYTPGTFSDTQHPHITTDAHEFALPVLFESALQHMPDRPDVYLSFSDEIKDFWTNLPTTWDDIKFLGGYPGESVIIARQKGNKWYVAGINGTDGAKMLNFDLSSLGLSSADVTLYTDSKTSEKGLDITNSSELSYALDCRPRGGFVAVVSSK